MPDFEVHPKPAHEVIDPITGVYTGEHLLELMTNALDERNRITVEDFKHLIPLYRKDIANDPVRWKELSKEYSHRFCLSHPLKVVVQTAPGQELKDATPIFTMAPRFRELKTFNEVTENATQVIQAYSNGLDAAQKNPFYAYQAEQALMVIHDLTREIGLPTAEEQEQLQQITRDLEAFTGRTDLKLTPLDEEAVTAKKDDEHREASAILDELY